MQKTYDRVHFISVFFLGVVIGTIVVALISAGELYDYQDSVDGVHLPQVDAVVCLAGGRGRIAASGDVWFRYWELAHRPVPEVEKNPAPAKTPILYISGMGHQANWSVFQKQIRTGVRGVIQPEDVILETESTNTDQNAQWLAEHAKKRKWERVLLITSRYHMKRALFIFDRVSAASGVKLKLESLSYYQDPFEPDEWRTSPQGIRVTLYEYAKWLYYRYFWVAKR